MRRKSLKEPTILTRCALGITKSTKNRGLWELVYQEECETRGEAMRRERFLKSGRGREELKRLIERGSAG